MVTTETLITVTYKRGGLIRDKNGSQKMNKVKKEKQITLILHVDDLMMSCEENF